VIETDVWFWVWAVAAVVLFVGEIFTAGFFLLPFGVGATVAAVIAFLDFSTGVQWAAFILVSTVAFISLRRLADRLTHEPPEKTGSDRLIGKVGSVIEDLTPHSPAGQVRIDREEWRAEVPGSEEIIPVGTRVTVERVEGTHLVVRPEVARISEEPSTHH